MLIAIKGQDFNMMKELRPVAVAVIVAGSLTYLAAANVQVKE